MLLQEFDCVPQLERVTVLGLRGSPTCATINGNSIVNVAFDGNDHILSMSGLNCSLRDSFAIQWWTI